MIDSVEGLDPDYIILGGNEKMKKLKFGLVAIGMIGILFQLSGCTKEEGVEQAKELAEAFLQEYYTVTKEEVVDVQTLFEEEDISKFNEEYEKIRMQYYSKMLSDDAYEMLKANRELLGLAKLAGEFDMTFGVDDIVLELNHENKDEKMLIFDYIVTLTSEKLSKEQEMIKGQIRIDHIDGDYVIGYVELKQPKM